MKSIKPGRGPSLLSGIVGIFMIGFGVLWTGHAFQSSPTMGIFGILWTAIAVVITVYNLRNAKRKNRYSQFDIVDANEEPDPLNTRLNGEIFSEIDGEKNAFCPYCGAAVKEDFEYCRSCGKKLP